MSFISTYDERNRLIRFTYHIDGKEEHNISHTYSSAYYQAIIADDMQSASDILGGQKDLEYVVTRDVSDEEMLECQC